MSDQPLLPPNATAQERALDLALARLADVADALGVLDGGGPGSPAEDLAPFDGGDVDGRDLTGAYFDGGAVVQPDRPDPARLPIRDLWNPATCPAAALPFLAWALSVDTWDPSWTEEQKRATIAGSIALHQRKGSVASVKNALAAAGYGDAEILERVGNLHDGSILRDGSEVYALADHWAEYRVVLSRRITNGQAAIVRAICAATAPARCHLKVLDYSAAAFLYNGELSPRDGTYNHGAA